MRPCNSRSTITRSPSQKTRSRTRSRKAEMGHFCKSRPQEKLSRKTIQFIVIANCRNRPLSANHVVKKSFTISQKNFLVVTNCRIKSNENHDLKKNCTASHENYTISCDRKLQK